VLTGKILRIDNDFTAVDNKPVFKVRCSFDTDQLRLKNGFTGQLKKGLGFQASFMVARRSLWQLLFDKMDDWLNPDAPATTITLPIEQCRQNTTTRYYRLRRSMSCIHCRALPASVAR
jgi:hypothetical protein